MNLGWIVVISQVCPYTVGMARLIDAIREAIDASEETRYRISKGSGVSQAQLSRLMSGEAGISVQTAERLADYLGITITIRQPRRRKDSC